MCKSAIFAAGHILLLCCIALFIVSVTVAADKPLLSEEIRQVIETQGIDAAKKRFAELYPSREDQYNFDSNGMFKLGSDYLQDADMEKGMAIMEMNSKLIQAQMMSSPMMQQLAEQQRIEKQNRQKQQQQMQQQNEIRVAEQFGTPREDLERFKGIYGDPKTRNKRKALWIMVSCDGYLVSGATWGDASPWWMKSVADRKFTYADSFQSLNVEFEIDADGMGKGITHDLNFLPSPLIKIGPPPNGWGECMENRMKEQHR